MAPTRDGVQDLEERLGMGAQGLDRIIGRRERGLASDAPGETALVDVLEHREETLAQLGILDVLVRGVAHDDHPAAADALGHDPGEGLGQPVSLDGMADGRHRP